MNIPAMDYIGCGFNWLFVLLCLGGYFYILSQTGRKWVFLLIWASAWFISALSYIFLIVGVAAGEWYITLLRTITYVLFLATILTAIAELVKSGKKK
jgi:predicted membrane protein